jgi:adenylate cyclase
MRAGLTKLLAWLRQRTTLLVPIAAVFSCALLMLLNPLPLQLARHAVFDQFQRWQPRAAQPAPVRIIDIDDESLQRLGQWPWPRTRLAELAQRLQQAQAAAIAFDIVFAEPDRTSPAAMLQLWQPAPDIRQQIGRLPDHDAVFADVLAQGRAVLGFALDQQPPHQQRMPQSKARFVSLGEPAWLYVPAFTGSVASLPILEASAAGNGALSFVPDGDGVVRRVPLLARQGETLLPTLVTEALRVAQGVPNITTRTVAGLGLEELRIGQLSLPTTPQGEMWVHYSAPMAGRYLPAWKVLAGEVAPAELEGKILLVGTSAQGLLDLRFSALGAIIPGVEIHAQLLEQILTGGGLIRPTWAQTVELMLLLAAGLLAGGAALGLGALPSFAVFALVLVAVWGAAWRAFAQHGLLLDPVPASLALVLAFVLSTIVRHVATERRQRWVKQAFSRYVSPNLVNHLVDHPEALKLGGQRQQCSFVFSDLQGFTRLMEGLDPGEAVVLLNRYLDGMISIAFEHQGTLDRIVGDAVAIVFSAPLQQSDHATRALRCALAMQRFAHHYAQDLQAKGIAFGQTRMGVHTGEVIVGNFGGTTMFDYRALGDPVNTASRLESANRHLGTLVCVSEAVVAASPEVQVRPVGRLVLKGKSIPLKVFEPLEAGAVDVDFQRAYQKAFELMCNESDAALVAFEHLAAQHPADGLCAMHLARLRAGKTGDLMVLDSK